LWCSRGQQRPSTRSVYRDDRWWGKLPTPKTIFLCADGRSRAANSHSMPPIYHETRILQDVNRWVRRGRRGQNLRRRPAGKGGLFAVKARTGDGPRSATTSPTMIGICPGCSAYGRDWPADPHLTVILDPRRRPAYRAPRQRLLTAPAAVLASKSGLFAVKARMIRDCTGNGDLDRGCSRQHDGCYPLGRYRRRLAPRGEPQLITQSFHQRLGELLG
jgi:hypothetical protein